MNITIWADDFRVFGNVYDDCDHHVSMFDGKAGETKIIVSPQSPLGFDIIKTENRKLIIKSILDNCGGEEEWKKFTAKCQSIDMDTLEKRQVKCP